MSRFRFVVVPHTHWDREWYLPFERFRLRLGEVVDEVLDVLERDPSFGSFTASAWCATCCSAGTCAGASASEPSRAGYLPAFGHPAQLPQLLAGFGIRVLLFSRGLGDEVDEVGVVFRWRAPDGSEVVAAQLLPHYDGFAELRSAADGRARADAIVDRFGAALERAGCRAIALGNVSDHLPVQPELPRIVAELGPAFALGTFADVADELAALPGLPAFSGELVGGRLQNVLRGVNSARLYLKQANARAERRLLSVEALLALASLRDGSPSPAADVRMAWRDLLRNQPHDSVRGCSCDEVHRDMLVRFDQLDRTLDSTPSAPTKGRRRGGAGGPTSTCCVPAPSSGSSRLRSTHRAAG